MGMGRETLIRVGLDFEIAKPNRLEVQIAQRGRQRIHLTERLLDRPPKRKDLERKKHLAERRIRKKNPR